MKAAEIGQLIKKRRALLNVDQTSLGEISGVAVHTISDIESGKGNPTMKILTELLDALGMELTVKIKKIRNNE